MPDYSEALFEISEMLVEIIETSLDRETLVDRISEMAKGLKEDAIQMNEGL